MSWLDDMLEGVKTIVSSTATMPQRSKLKITGAGVTSIVDDPTNDQTVVTLGGGGGGGTPTGTGLYKVVAGTMVAAAALLVNADVDAAAAIAGTKVSPDFGSQAIVTLGNASAATVTASTSFVGPLFDSVSGAGATTVTIGGTNALSLILGRASLAVTVPGYLTPGGTLPTSGFMRVAYQAGSLSVIRGNVTAGGGGTEADIIAVSTNTVTFGSLTSICAYYGFSVNISAAGSMSHFAATSIAHSAPFTTFSSYLGSEAFRITPASAGTTSLQFAATVTVPQILHAQNASTTGVAMSIVAQVGASTFASGDLQLGGGAAAGGGGASAAGHVDFINQTLSGTGSSIIGGQSLAAILVNGLPVKIGGSLYKVVVMAT